MYSRIIVAAIVCSYVHPAHAEPSAEDLKKASALFDEAEKKFKIGEYQLALADYKSAYLLTGEPALLFNIGQCHRFLGNDPEAIKSYKNFLRDANPEGNQRAIAEKLIAELENKIPAEQKATLEVKAPSGAEGAIFFIDGTAIGPLPISTAIATGKHNIELRRENVILYSETVEIKPGETRSLSIQVQSQSNDVTLRFQTTANKRAYQVSLQTPNGLISCPQNVTSLLPCELKTSATGAATLRIDSLAQEITIPTQSSALNVLAPKAPKPAAKLFIPAASAALIGGLMAIASPYPGNIPELPGGVRPAGRFPGQGVFRVGVGFAVVGGVTAVGSGAILIKRKSENKKYLAEKPSFTPLEAPKTP